MTESATQRLTSLTARFKRATTKIKIEEECHQLEQKVSNVGEIDLKDAKR